MNPVLYVLIAACVMTLQAASPALKTTPCSLGTIWNMYTSKCLTVSGGKRGGGALLTLADCSWNKTDEWQHLCLSALRLPDVTLSTAHGNCVFAYNTQLFTAEDACSLKTDKFVIRARLGKVRYGVVITLPEGKTCLTAKEDKASTFMEPCDIRNVYQLWQICDASGDLCTKTVAKYLSK